MDDDSEQQIIKHKTRLDRYVGREDADDKIVYLLRKLAKVQVTLDLLSKTGIGRTVNAYRKKDGEIGELAKTLVMDWKRLLPPDSPPPSIKTETVCETSYESSTSRSDPQRTPYMDTAVRSGSESESRSEKVKVKAERSDEAKVKTKEEREGSYDRYKVKKEKERERDRERERERERYKDRDERKERSSKERNVKKEKYDPGFEKYDSQGSDDDENVASAAEENDDDNEKDDDAENDDGDDDDDDCDDLEAMIMKQEQEELRREKHKSRDSSHRLEKEHRHHRDEKRHREEKESRDRHKSKERQEEKHRRDEKHRDRHGQSSRKDKEHSVKEVRDVKVKSESDNEAAKCKEKEEKHRSGSDKHKGESSKHRSDSSKHGSDSSKHKSDGSKHSSDSAGCRSDSKSSSDKSKHRSDSGKHSGENSKHRGENSKHRSENSKHSSESSKHSSESSKHSIESSKNSSESSKHSSESSKNSGESSKHSGEKNSAEESSKAVKEVKNSFEGRSEKEKEVKIEKKKDDRSSSGSQGVKRKVAEVATEASDDENNGFSFEDMLNYNPTKGSKKKKLNNTKPLPSAESSKSSQEKKKTNNEKSHKTKSHREKSHSSSKKEKSHSSSSSSRRGNDLGSSNPESEGFKVPEPKGNLGLSEDDIVSLLPEINPNYKPLPHLSLDSLEKKKNLALLDDVAITSKKNFRFQMYSGRKAAFLKSVPSLFDSCMQVLKDNVDALDYVGGVPFDILKPVLETCNATQLYHLEDVNPQFIGETEELWEAHSKRDFRKAQPDEFESWRELYLRCHDERDRKLKNLTAKVTANMSASQPVRQTKLAYVDSAAKPPRHVKRQQMRHGTAGRVKEIDPLSKLSSHGGKKPVRPAVAPVAEMVPLGRQKKEERKVAPMMRKTISFIKRMQRR